MPRTLPAALTTVMDAGIYEPYIRVAVNISKTETGQQLVQPLAYKIEPLKATVTIPFTPDYDYGTSVFRIIRGAVINGIPSTISTIWFNTIEFKYNGKLVTLEGELLQKLYTTVTADSDYETVIEAALENPPFDPIVPNYEGTAAWKAYQFYPTGRTIVLSPTKKLFTLLQQKYLIFATEDGWDGTDDNIFFFVATDARTKDYTITDQLFNYNSHSELRKLISRDESNVIHSTGLATSIIHNLGFLHSTASQPTNATNFALGKSSKLPVHLKRRTGDKVEILQNDNFTPTANGVRVRITEVLDTSSTPSWYQIVEALQWYSATEGGALPSTIEAAAPYTPLATGNFDNVLSTNDNNLQAAMETVDDHDHSGGAAFTEVVQDIIGAMLSGNTETGIAVDYQDSDGTIDFVAEVTQAEFDSTIDAVIALLPAAETNSNDIFRCDNSGASSFAGTIATLPGGAVLTYNVTSGQENAMVPTSTSQLAKMRLYNTTRGTSALISNCVAGTNTITLTANVPAGWQVADVITIASQTVSGGTGNWVDLEITSGPLGLATIWMNISVVDTTNTNIGLRLHPLITFSAAKIGKVLSQAVNVTNDNCVPIPITNNVFSASWNPAGAASMTVTLREAAYFK